MTTSAIYTLPTTDTFCGYTAMELFNNSCTQKGLERIITTALNYKGIEWRLYGGRANQSNALKANSDAVTALVELVTNTFDGNAEYALTAHPEAAKTCRTGFDIASSYHGMPGKFQPTKPKWRTSGGFEPQVTLHGDFDLNKVTVDVADHGIGMDVDTVENTILSLNATNKFYNPLMFGMFGQGRAAMLHFSDASIVFTRTEDSDGLVVVLMRKLKTNDIDPDKGQPLPCDQWRYAVLTSTGACPVLKVDGGDITFGLEPEVLKGVDAKTLAYYDKCLRERGTIVRHTNFYVARHGALQRFGYGGGSGLYQLLNEHIAGGPYLIEIDDLRTEKGNIGGAQNRQVVAGNLRKMLKKVGTPEMLHDSGWQEFDKYDTFRSDTDNTSPLRFRIFIMDNDPHNKRTAHQNLSGKSGKWLSPHNSGGIFFNGQLHDRVKTSVIRKSIPHLVGNTLIFVDGDNLSNEVKNEMLGSSREHIDVTHCDYIHDGILVPYIDADEDIQRLHEERRLSSLTDKSDADDRILAEVNSIFNVKPTFATKKNLHGLGGRTRGANGGGPGREKDVEIPVTTVTSKQYLKINGNHKIVRIGSIFVVSIETNIPRDRFYPDSRYCTMDKPDFLDTYFNVSGPEGDFGPTRLFFKVKPDAIPNAQGDLKIRITNREGDIKTAKQDFITLEAQPKKPQRGGKFYLKAVELITADHPAWALGFSGAPDDMLAYIEDNKKGDGGVTLYLSVVQALIQGAEQEIVQCGKSGSRNAIYLHYFEHEYLKKHAALAALGFLTHIGEVNGEPSTAEKKSVLDNVMLSSLEGYINLFLKNKASIVPSNYEIK